MRVRRQPTTNDTSFPASGNDHQPVGALRGDKEIPLGAEMPLLTAAEHIGLSNHLHGEYLSRVDELGVASLTHQLYHAKAAFPQDPKRLVLVEGGPGRQAIHRLHRGNKRLGSQGPQLAGMARLLMVKRRANGILLLGGKVGAVVQLGFEILEADDASTGSCDDFVVVCFQVDLGSSGSLNCHNGGASLVGSRAFVDGLQGTALRTGLGPGMSTTLKSFGAVPHRSRVGEA